MLSFSPAVNYPVGNSPQAVVTGDFNGDGRLDLAVANAVSNTVSVLLGNANGTFQPAQNSATGTGPQSMAVGDFNDDGKLDLVTANALRPQRAARATAMAPSSPPATSTSARIRRRWPWATSTPTASSTSGSRRTCIISAVALTPTTTVLRRPRQRAAGQRRRLVPDRRTRPRSTIGRRVSHVGGRGRLQRATANKTSRRSTETLERSACCWATATATFLGRPTSAIGNYPLSVAAGDVNGDSHIDLVTANFSDNNVSVLLGDGAGGFGAAQNYAVGSLPISVVLADFNHDTHLDIVTANSDYYNTGVSVLLGTGDGTFSSALELPGRSDQHLGRGRG